MSPFKAVRDTLGGIKSLITGMSITMREATKPIITVQYPHETLKMPDQFRGHIKLILDQETGKARCTACNLCAKACPSDCIVLDGAKKEGDKRKWVTEYHLDFTLCSLCGACVEVCPFDAIEFSKVYNKVGFTRDDFDNMDMVKVVNEEARIWAENHPQPPPAPAPTVSAPDATPAAEPKTSGEAPKLS